MRKAKSLGEFIQREKLIGELVIAIAGREGLTYTAHSIVKQAEAVWEEYEARLDSRIDEMKALMEAETSSDEIAALINGLTKGVTQ